MNHNIRCGYPDELAALPASKCDMVPCDARIPFFFFFFFFAFVVVVVVVAAATVLRL